MSARPGDPPAGGGTHSRSVHRLLVDHLLGELAPGGDPGRRVRGWVAGVLFAAGGVLAFLTIPISGTHADDDVVAALAGGALACSAVSFFALARLPVLAVHVLALVAVGLVSAAVAVGGQAHAGYTSFYFWIVLYVAYFFGWRTSLAYSLVVAATYGAIVSAPGFPELEAETWAVTAVTVTVAGAVSGLLVERLRGAAAGLALREARVRLLMEQASDGIFVAGRDGRYLDANARGLEMLGFTLDELRSLTMSDLVDPADLAARPLRMDALVRGATVVTERTLVRKDGSRLEAEISARMTEDGRFLGIVRDVTERRRTQAELTRLSRQNELVLTAVAEGLVAVDAAGTATLVNPSAAKMLGWEAEELLGRTLDDLVPPGSRAAVLAGEAVTGEEALVRRDGTRFPVRFAASPIYDDGKVTGAVVAFADISEQRRLEELLRQAQKLEAVGRPAGGVAHDFNNLLTAITGYAELALGVARGDSRIADDLRQIVLAAERASDLTRRLLAFSRKQAPDAEVLDLNHVVAGLHAMLRRLIDEHIEVVTLPAPEPALVLADRRELEQVVLNLAVNARDAMPRGGKLTVAVSRVPLAASDAARLPGLVAGDHVVLTVADTGVGMDEFVRSHLFEPFFTTKEPGKGTGLGLATVRGIVERSGGAIDVASAPALGASFRIYLPEVEPLAVEAPDATRVEPDRGTETILLVEDESSVRGLAARVLRSRGYEVLEARYASEALEVFESRLGQVDLVLSDVVMPGLSGPELAERLQARRPGLPVLLMSGYAEGYADAGRQSALGFRLLEKPFTPLELGAAVRATLDGTAEPS